MDAKTQNALAAADAALARMADEERARFARDGFAPVGVTPEEMAAILRAPMESVVVVSNDLFGPRKP